MLKTTSPVSLTPPIATAAPSDSLPSARIETRVVVRLIRSRTKTSVAPLSSSGTRLVASERKTT